MTDEQVVFNSISNNDILISIKEIQLEFQKELKGFKDKELEIQKEQLEVQKELKGFKEKELEIQIRKNAIEFLKNNYGITPRDYNLDFFINNNNCIKQLLNLDIDLFSLLLNIDYKNLTVSFNYFNENKNYNNYIEKNSINNYFSDAEYYRAYGIEGSTFNKYKLLINYYENIINNPIYKNLKNKLEIDDYYKYNFESYKNNILNVIQNGYLSYEYYNINNISYLYYSNYYIIEYIQINIVVNNNIQYSNNYPSPYKEICNYNIFKNIYTCQDTSSYNYNNKQTEASNIHCGVKTIIEYEHNKQIRYLNLLKRWNTIYSNYYNEIYELYNEYEYIKQLINLEEIPIIPPIKF